MAAGQKDQKSKQAGAGKSGAAKAAGSGGMGPEKNLGTSHGHANGVGEIYEKQGFGVNEAMSEAARDDAILDHPVKGAASSSGAGKGAQGSSGAGRGAGQSGRNAGKS